MPTKKNLDELLTSCETKAVNHNPFQLIHPYRAICCARSGGGKSYWILKNILLDTKMPFDLVIWCAPPFSLQQSKLQQVKKKLGNKLMLIEGLDQEKLQNLIEHKKKSDQWLIVLDDLMSKTDEKFINDLFTSGRHLNISTIEIVQRLFGSKNGRTHRLNAEYFILGSFPDQTEVRHLLRQLEPKHYNALMDCYKQSTERDQGHGMFIIDNKYHDPQTGAGLLKYRDNSLDQAWVL